MAQTIGFVIGTSDDGWATVVADKGQGCGSCSAVSACHAGRSPGSRRTSALNRIGAAVGDRVTLTVKSGDILSRLALLYLLPVVAMLTGAFLGAALDGGPVGTSGGHSVGFGLAGFLLGFALSVAISRFWSTVRPLTPIITRILSHRSVSPSSPPATRCGQ